jgi:primosomal protein N' (replication factor Y)
VHAAALGEALPDGCDLLGPAPMFRVRGRHRRRLLIKSDDRAAAVAAVGDVVEMLASDRSSFRRVAVGVDVDPQ